MKALILAGAVLLAAGPAAADGNVCGGGLCLPVFTLHSVSVLKSYGVLLKAPDGGCRRVRLRVQTATAAFLGHTPPLVPGEVAVVRMGHGFAAPKAAPPGP